MLSEDLTIDGREYNLDYKEQANRTIIVISSRDWDEQDLKTTTRLRELLAQKLSVDDNPKLPHMLFVHKKQVEGSPAAVPIEELKGIIKACLDEW
jgi:hypothetical protein